MNLHPIFVHFPIALFTLYVLFEIFRLRFLTGQAWYFYIKAVLVIAGSIMSFITVATGLMAQKFMQGHPALVYHKSFALATSVIFLVIALSYAFTWYARYKLQNGIVLESSLVKFAQWVVGGKAVLLLAVFGFVCLTITGGLGGAMVYGPDADPFFKPIYEFLIEK